MMFVFFSFSNSVPFFVPVHFYAPHALSKLNPCHRAPQGNTAAAHSQKRRTWPNRNTKRNRKAWLDAPLSPSPPSKPTHPSRYTIRGQTSRRTLSSSLVYGTKTETQTHLAHLALRSLYVRLRLSPTYGSHLSLGHLADMKGPKDMAPEARFPPHPFTNPPIPTVSPKLCYKKAPYRLMPMFCVAPPMFPPLRPRQTKTRIPPPPPRSSLPSTTDSFIGSWRACTWRRSPCRTWPPTWGA